MKTRNYNQVKCLFHNCILCGKNKRPYFNVIGLAEFQKSNGFYHEEHINRLEVKDLPWEPMYISMNCKQEVSVYSPEKAAKKWRSRVAAAHGLRNMGEG